MLFHEPKGIVTSDQEIPSVDLAAFVPLEVKDSVTKYVPFHAMQLRASKDGNVRDVQVMPSGDVAAVDEELPTAQKTVPFQATARQSNDAGIACGIQVSKSDEEYDVLLPPPLPLFPTSTHTDPFHAAWLCWSEPLELPRFRSPSDVFTQLIAITPPRSW